MDRHAVVVLEHEQGTKRQGERPARKAQPPRHSPTEPSGKPVPRRPPALGPQGNRPRSAAVHNTDLLKPEGDDPAPPPRPQISRSEALKILVDRANAGNPACLDGLRQLVQNSPEIWQQVGDLARHCELAWLELFAGGDQLVAESVKRYIKRLKCELAGPAPSPMERLLVEQVVITWLASRYAEMAVATPGPSSVGEAKIRLKRAESAQRRHLASIKVLSDLRCYCSKGVEVGDQE